MTSALAVRKLPPHLVKATERELELYPEYQREYAMRKRYVQDLATIHNSVGDGSEPVDGGPLPIPDLQRAMEKTQADRRLRILEARMGPIEEAVALLKETCPDLYILVEKKYLKKMDWSVVAEKLNVSDSQYFNLRRKALEHVAPFLWGVFADEVVE